MGSSGVSKPGSEQHRLVERLEPGAARIAAITAFNIRTARDDAKTDARNEERNRPAGFARQRSEEGYGEERRAAAGGQAESASEKTVGEMANEMMELDEKVERVKDLESFLDFV